MKNLTNEEKSLIIDALRSHKSDIEYALALNAVMAPGSPEDEAKFQSNVNNSIKKVEALAEKIGDSLLEY